MGSETGEAPSVWERSFSELPRSLLCRRRAAGQPAQSALSMQAVPRTPSRVELPSNCGVLPGSVALPG